MCKLPKALNVADGSRAKLRTAGDMSPCAAGSLLPPICRGKDATGALVPTSAGRSTEHADGFVHYSKGGFGRGVRPSFFHSAATCLHDPEARRNASRETSRGSGGPNEWPCVGCDREMGGPLPRSRSACATRADEQQKATKRKVQRMSRALRIECSLLWRGTKRLKRVSWLRGWWQVPPGQQQRPLLSAALHVCVACARQVTRDLALLVPCVARALHVPEISRV